MSPCVQPVQRALSQEMRAQRRLPVQAQEPEALRVLYLLSWQRASKRRGAARALRESELILARRCLLLRQQVQKV